MRSLITGLLFILTLSIAAPAFAQPVLNTLYRIQTFRTENGQTQKFLDAHFDLERGNFFDGWSVRAPFVLKRDKGDHWEIMTIHPMISYGEYFAQDKLALRRDAHRTFQSTLDELYEVIEFEENVFAAAASLPEMEQRFADNSIIDVSAYHIKAGAMDEAREIIARWNRVREELSLAPLSPWLANAGSDVDLFLFEFYVDQTGAVATITKDEKDQAAQQQGFNSYDDIAVQLAKHTLQHKTTRTIVMTLE